MAVPHVLPSTLLTVSASATFELSRLNSTPHRIAVYASCPPSPTNTQHSLSGARYGLPVPVFHRLDHASLPGAQTIIITRHGRPIARIVPEASQRQQEIDEAMADIEELRKHTGKVSIEEILAWRHEGHKY